jgi:hypothetical protein
MKPFACVSKTATEGSEKIIPVCQIKEFIS